MDQKARKILDERKNRNYFRSFSQGNNKKSSNFSVKSLLLLACLTAFLLILPVVLPPLPPPPFMMLLIPIGILAVLMVLAFMPSDVRNINSSHV
ncbi:hypothetical protein ACHQM5_005832 [Ranunculus cassubicifolius]